MKNRSPRSQRAAFIALLAAAAAVWVAGCRTAGPSPPPPLSAAQREAIQTREIKGDFETVFAAVLSVLQDEGWEIVEVDRASGLVQASSLRHQSLFGPADDWRSLSDPRVKKIRQEAERKRRHEMTFAQWSRWEALTARIEPWHRGTVRVRLSIVKHGMLPSSYR